MSDSQWFYESNGQQAGPISWESLMVGLKQGTVTRETLVWSQHLKEWTPLSQVLKKTEAPVAPPPVSRPAFQTEVNADPATTRKPRRSMMRILAWIGGGLVAVVLLLLAIGVMVGASGVRSWRGREAKAVRLVKTGHLQSHPEKTVGDAVDAFFGDPKWESGTGVAGETEGKTLVDATGRINYLDKAVNARIQFVVNTEEGTFELRAFEMNGIPQNQLMTGVLIEKMYE
ncbi:MAG: DUF4339 domain-containing protein [Acidobacteriota bacterium]|nr:DUF4339 domain-containing protein [Acidobacteriota bacterium]